MRFLSLIVLLCIVGVQLTHATHKISNLASYGCGCQPCPCSVQPVSCPTCSPPIYNLVPTPITQMPQVAPVAQVPQMPVLPVSHVPQTPVVQAPHVDAATAKQLEQLTKMQHQEDMREKQIEEMKEQAEKEKHELMAEMEGLKKKLSAEENHESTNNEEHQIEDAEHAIHNATHEHEEEPKHEEQHTTHPNVTIEVHPNNVAALTPQQTAAQGDLSTMENKVKVLTERLQVEEAELQQLQAIVNRPQINVLHPPDTIGFESHDFELTLEAPWKAVEHDFGAPKGYLEDDYCVLSGLVQGDSGLIMTLPQQCRPTNGRVVFSVLQGNAAARVDILSDGRVYKVIGGQAGNQWLTLNGISFATRGGEELPLIHGWQTYGSTYRAPQITQHGGLCVLSGMLRGNQWDFIARIPEFCRPVGRLVFTLNNNKGTTRIDVLDSGYLLYNGGSKEEELLSLDGLSWTVEGGAELSLKGKWGNYGTPFRAAKYERVMDWCVVSGLVINKDQWSRYIALLPSECRPATRLTFSVNVHLGQARVDVLPSGKIMYISGKRSWNWLSLSGISFTVAEPHRNEEHNENVYASSQYNPVDEHEGQNSDIVPAV